MVTCYEIIDIFIQVPFWDIAKKNSSKEEQLRQSYEKFCRIFPAFHLPGKTCDPMEYIDLTDPGMHLVCKYLLRYKNAELDEIIDPSKWYRYYVDYDINNVNNYL